MWLLRKVHFFLNFPFFFPQLLYYISLARTSSTILIMRYISEQDGILLTVKELAIFFPLKYGIALILGRGVYQVAGIYHNCYVFIRYIFLDLLRVFLFVFNQLIWWFTVTIFLKIPIHFHILKANYTR